MKRLVTAAFVALAAVLASSAAAQVPAQDSVRGSGVARTVGTDTTFDFVINAHSGPSGENPGGQVTFRSTTDGSVFFSGPVTCLAVNGNLAVLDVATPQFHVVGMEVTDSPSGDLIRAIPTGPSSCSPLGSAVSFEVISGDLVVTDASALPTTKNQCKSGGWRAYGVFKNQGDCVSFVASGGKNPAQRPLAAGPRLGILGVMSQENVDILRTWIEAFNRRDEDTLAQLHHPAVEWQTSAEDPDATTHRGRAAVRRYIDGYLDAFPDLHIDITECFPVGSDSVFTTNHFSGHSASGVPMDWLLTTLTTYNEGRVYRVAEYFSRAEALEAVGLSK